MDKLNKDKLNNVAQRLGLISVVDMERYTALELMLMISNKVNELIVAAGKFESDMVNTVRLQNKQIQYLLDEGLYLEVGNVFDEWVQDGTFDTLINQTAFKTVNDRIAEATAQLSHKADDNEVVKKGSGTLNDFDEETRGILQGLTHGQINAVLGEKNVKEENIDDEVITPRHIKNDYLYAFSQLNPYNLVKNPCMVATEKGWNGIATGKVSYDNDNKIDGFNSITITATPESSNNHCYQIISALQPSTFIIKAIVDNVSSPTFRLVVLGYKANKHVKEIARKTFTMSGRVEVTFTVTTDTTVDEIRPVFEIQNGESGTIRVSQVSVTKFSDEIHDFLVTQGKMNLMKDMVYFNPNNISGEHGSAIEWSNIDGENVKYSNETLDGFSTVKISTDGTSSVVPYKAVDLISNPLTGTVSIGFKVKHILADSTQPKTFQLWIINYKNGLITGGKVHKKSFSVSEDGESWVYMSANVEECTRIHACICLEEAGLTLYANQCTVIHGLPQYHQISQVYQAIAGVENTVVYSTNPLYKKSITFNGDSIMYGAGYTGGFAKIIANRNNMEYQNIAIGGGTIASNTYYGADKGGGQRHWICQTVENMNPDADYIIFEGGINDYWNKVPLGSITPDYNSEFDTTTFCGGFESMLKQAILKYQGKKIGFIITHKITNTFYPYGNETSGRFELYYEKIIEMCNKWSIPYLDLFNTSGLNSNIQEIKEKYFDKADGVHPNELGYRAYYVDKVEAWLKTL